MGKVGFSKDSPTYEHMARTFSVVGDPADRGRGYATEAARRLLEFAFAEGKLPEVVATFDRGNLASRHVLVKAGFTDHGTMRCYGSDGVNFRITRDDWLERQVKEAAL